jgi:hypothetical protein
LIGVPATAQGVPSGQPVVLWQVLFEQVDGQGSQAVLRFLAPQIAREGGSVGYDAAREDMDWLCETHGLPLAALPYVRADSAVVEMTDRALPRGQVDPEATRFFEVYSLADGTCAVDAF